MPRLGLGLAIGNVNTLLPVPIIPPTPVALPFNPAGPVVYVSNKSAGNVWFFISTSTQYGRTYWWDGTFTDTVGSFMMPTKTAAGGIVRLSAFSTDAAGAPAGQILNANPAESVFLSIDYSGTQINSASFTSDNYVLSSLNFTGCKTMNSLNITNQFALSSLIMTGCSAVTTFYVYGTALSSVVVPTDLVTTFYCYGNPLLKTVTLRGYKNGGGYLYISSNNALPNIDLSPIRPSAIGIYGNASLSAITFGSAISAASLVSVQANSNNLSAIDLSSLVNAYSLNLYGNKLTSIIMPAGFTSQPNSVGFIDLSYNQLDATALNNFFTNLGTYAGAYDVYGVGGTINYYGNPGSATCNPSIASAKGWQPF